MRPVTRNDADEITKMFVELETLLSGLPESTVEDLYDDWTEPGFEMERDSWVVMAGDELVGYAAVVRHHPPNIYTAYGGVRPSHWSRGIGTFLFEAVEQLAVHKAGGPARVRQWIDAKDKPAIAILGGRGYEFVRRFWRMDLDLGAELSEPEEIEGVRIRLFEQGRDERLAHEVHEEAFAQHWGYRPRTYEQAVNRWEAEWFRADLSLVAEADGRMVAFCINGIRFDEGYVEDIGVLDGYRGRGIGEALLRESFKIFKDLGLSKASLNVDSDNSTGAMRLYERVGMHTGTSYDIYERSLG